jgi:hypothetical protein
MSSISEELKNLTQAGASAKAAPVVAPAPTPVEPPAAASVPVVVAEVSAEPTIVKYEEPAVVPVSASKGTPLVDPAGKLRAYITVDGKLVAVTSEESADPLAGFSDANRAPVDLETEARLDLSPRSSGRIKFLEATYELGHPERAAARRQNDLGRELYQRKLTAKKFDPSTSANAAEINRFLQR